MGSFSLSWPIVVILNYFVNVHWTSLKQWNLETSVSCYPEMQWKLFHSTLKIPTTILLTVCYFLYQAFSSDNFFAESNKLLYQYSSNYWSKADFRYGFCANNSHKSIKSSFCKYFRAVSIIVAKWKTTCIRKHCATRKWSSVIHGNHLFAKEISIFRDWMLQKRSLMKCLPYSTKLIG